MKTAKRATIKDVAALAGVSCATVSRALDDRSEISRETKVRVRAACAQLAYVPNVAAKGLAGQRTHTIGLIVPDISNPYFSGMATAIENTAAENGYRVMLSNSLRDEALELQAIENFLSRRVDGLIISATTLQSYRKHKQLLGSLPCVYLGVNHDEDCSYVMADNDAGAYAATRYLLELGHRDIRFVGGRPLSLTRKLRLQGFLRAMAEEGLEGKDFAASERQWSLEESLALLSGALPDAIFAFSDVTAMKLMEAAEQRGIRIPEDLSILGYDNIAFSALPRIHLTSVSQRKFCQGRCAVERLLEQINGRRERTAELLQPELLIRSTCSKNEKGGMPE